MFWHDFLTGHPVEELFSGSVIGLQDFAVHGPVEVRDETGGFTALANLQVDTNNQPDHSLGLNVTEWMKYNENIHLKCFHPDVEVDLCHISNRLMVSNDSFEGFSQTAKNRFMNTIHL